MRTLEKLLWVCGFLMLSIYFGHVAIAEFQREQSVASFKTQQQVQPDASFVAPGIPDPDQSLWSTGRIASYKESQEQDSGDVLGVFSIPRLGLEVPVYDSATELHMNRGVARIDGTATPGESGNLGIAGHRDGYFRVLKDIKFGDQLTLQTAGGAQTYIVQQLMIVDPSEVGVLEPTPESAITLVTCYPFYFVGHAPERFIVRAVLQESMSDQNRQEDI